MGNRLIYQLNPDARTMFFPSAVNFLRFDIKPEGIAQFKGEERFIGMG
jgi:hypothetical protein